MSRKGKFIIIEGTDGSGKTTQLKYLKKYLEEKGEVVKTLDFPQYENFWGKQVGRFLKGEFGEMDDVNPYLASPFFFLDQATKTAEINMWLEKGYFVLSNRYVTSSMAHQTCKFETENEQDEFIDWLTTAAYGELGLVKEDMTIVLHADPKISKQLANKSKDRKTNYTDGKDIHEDHPTHIKDSTDMYLKLCKNYESWECIDCMKDGQIDTIENIHSKIVDLVSELVKEEVVINLATNSEVKINI